MRRVPLSIKFSRQEYWSGLAFLSPGDLPDPGIKSVSPAFQVDSLPLGHQRSPILIPLKVRKPRRADLLPLPSSDALPKSRALLLPGQRAFPPGGRRYNRDSRHTGGCGFGEKPTGAMSHLNDGWPTGCQLQPDAPLLPWFQPQHSESSYPTLGREKFTI